MAVYTYPLAFLVSAMLVIWASIWTYAEFIVLTPKANIAHWEKMGAIDAPQAAKEAVTRFKKALRLNSSNAEFYMDFARLRTLQANTQQISDKEKKYYQIQTIKNLKLALSKRPTWGQAWGKLAQAYAKQPSKKDQFIQSLERALKFEPYSRRNKPLLIQLSIKHWTVLPESLKDKLKTSIFKKALNQRKTATTAINAAIKNNWTKELDSMFEKKWQKSLLKKTIKEKLQNNG